MDEKLAQIPGRIKELREILEISAMDMAKDIHIPLDTTNMKTANRISRSAF